MSVTGRYALLNARSIKEVEYAVMLSLDLGLGLKTKFFGLGLET